MCDAVFPHEIFCIYIFCGYFLGKTDIRHVKITWGLIVVSGNMKFRFVCFAALCLFVFAACEGTDPVPPDDPVVEEPVPEIMADSVLASFPVGGGEFSFS